MFVYRILLRRLGPLGVALTAIDVWRRLPATQRRRIRALGLRTGRWSVVQVRALLARAAHR